MAGDLVALGIEGHGDAGAELRARLLQSDLVLECHGAQDGPVGAGGQHLFYVVHRAQPTARLDRAGREPHDFEHQFSVARDPRLGPVEIDDVKPASPRSGEPERDLDRVVRVDGLGSESSLSQPHAAPVRNVDRGDDRPTLL